MCHTRIKPDVAQVNGIFTGAVQQVHRMRVPFCQTLQIGKSFLLPTQKAESSAFFFQNKVFRWPEVKQKLSCILQDSFCQFSSRFMWKNRRSNGERILGHFMTTTFILTALSNGICFIIYSKSSVGESGFLLPVLGDNNDQSPLFYTNLRSFLQDFITQSQCRPVCQLCLAQRIFYACQCN